MRLIFDDLNNGFKENVSQEYPVQIYPKTPRDIDRSCRDYSAIQASLRWELKVNFEDGLKNIVSWLQSAN